MSCAVSAQTLAALHEGAFRRLDGRTRVVVLGNVRDGLPNTGRLGACLSLRYRDVSRAMAWPGCHVAFAVKVQKSKPASVEGALARDAFGDAGAGPDRNSLGGTRTGPPRGSRDHEARVAASKWSRPIRCRHGPTDRDGPPAQSSRTGKAGAWSHVLRDPRQQLVTNRTGARTGLRQCALAQRRLRNQWMSAV